MKNYDEMSDFEINQLVAGYLHGEEWWHKYSTVFTIQLKPTDSGGMETRKAPVDYCNNPLDARFILETAWGMAVEFDEEYGRVIVEAASNPFDTEKLRAAMICFLKMKDTEP